MFLELLVVAALLSFLYSRGLLDFNNPYAGLISAALAVAAGALGLLATRFLARRLVDSLAGLSAWTPPAKAPRPPAQRPSAAAPADLAALRRAAARAPSDAAASAALADALLAADLPDDFLAEKRRRLRNPALTCAEACSILHRMADVELRRGNIPAALDALDQAQRRFPATPEAALARRRRDAIAADNPPAPPEDPE